MTNQFARRFSQRRILRHPRRGSDFVDDRPCNVFTTELVGSTVPLCQANILDRLFGRCGKIDGVFCTGGTGRHYGKQLRFVPLFLKKLLLPV